MKDIDGKVRIYKVLQPKQVQILLANEWGKVFIKLWGSKLRVKYVLPFCDLKVNFMFFVCFYVMFS